MKINAFGEKILINVEGNYEIHIDEAFSVSFLDKENGDSKLEVVLIGSNEAQYKIFGELIVDES